MLQKNKINKTLIAKLTVIFISLITFFLLLELALGILGNLYSRKTEANLKTPISKDSYTILCLGDSYTFGIGAPEGKDYPSQLEAMLNSQYGKDKKFKVVNLGIGGGNTAQMLNKFRGFLEHTKPDLVIFLGGGSNSWNYLGYHDYLKDKSFLSKVNNCLYNIRIFKLAKLLSLNIKDKIKTETPRSLIPDAEAVNNKRYTDASRYLISDGWRYVPLRQYGRAIECFKKDIKTDPNISEYYAGIGLVYRSCGEYERAIKWIKKGIRINPNKSAYYVEIGHLYKDIREYDKAVKWLKKGIKVKPYDSACYMKLGQVRISMGDNKSALIYIKRALSLHKRSDKAMYAFFTIRAMNNYQKDMQGFLNKLKRNNKDIPQDIIDLLSMDKSKNKITDKIDDWVIYDTEKIIRICKENKIRILLQDYPCLSRMYYALRAVAIDSSVPFLSNYEVFSSLPQQEDFLSLDGHCNARGYELMARNLLSKIIEEKMMEFD